MTTLDGKTTDLFAAQYSGGVPIQVTFNKETGLNPFLLAVDPDGKRTLNLGSAQPNVFGAQTYSLGQGAPFFVNGELRTHSLTTIMDPNFVGPPAPASEGQRVIIDYVKPEGSSQWLPTFRQEHTQTLAFNEIALETQVRHQSASSDAMPFDQFDSMQMQGFNEQNFMDDSMYVPLVRKAGSSYVNISDRPLLPNWQPMEAVDNNPVTMPKVGDYFLGQPSHVIYQHQQYEAPFGPFAVASPQDLVKGDIQWQSAPLPEGTGIIWDPNLKSAGTEGMFRVSFDADKINMWRFNYVPPSSSASEGAAAQFNDFPNDMQMRRNDSLVNHTVANAGDVSVAVQDPVLNRPAGWIELNSSGRFGLGIGLNGITSLFGLPGTAVDVRNRTENNPFVLYQDATRTLEARQIAGQEFAARDITPQLSVWGNGPQSSAFLHIDPKFGIFGDAGITAETGTHFKQVRFQEAGKVRLEAEDIGGGTPALKLTRINPAEAASAHKVGFEGEMAEKGFWSNYINREITDFSVGGYNHEIGMIHVFADGRMVPIKQTIFNMRNKQYEGDIERAKTPALVAVLKPTFEDKKVPIHVKQNMRNILVQMDQAGELNGMWENAHWETTQLQDKQKAFNARGLDGLSLSALGEISPDYLQQNIEPFENLVDTSNLLFSRQEAIDIKATAQGTDYIHYDPMSGYSFPDSVQVGGGSFIIGDLRAIGNIDQTTNTLTLRDLGNIANYGVGNFAFQNGHLTGQGSYWQPYSHWENYGVTLPDEGGSRQNNGITNPSQIPATVARVRANTAGGVMFNTQDGLKGFTGASSNLVFSMASGIPQARFVGEGTTLFFNPGDVFVGNQETYGVSKRAAVFVTGDNAQIRYARNPANPNSGVAPYFAKNSFLEFLTPGRRLGGMLYEAPMNAALVSPRGVIANVDEVKLSMAGFMKPHLDLTSIGNDGFVGTTRFDS
ncbi:MAG: hypothetical protein WC464_09325, partial [Bdellovibrionales bacterium]